MAYKVGNLAELEAMPFSVERTGRSKFDSYMKKLTQDRTGKNHYSTSKSAADQPSKKNINTNISLSSLAKRVITSEIESFVRLEDCLLNQVELELRARQKKLFRQNRDPWSAIVSVKGDYEEAVALSLYLTARRISNNSQRTMEILELENLSKNKVFIDENKILLLLQKQPLTVQNLADTFDVSVEETHNVVRRLFSDGFIDKLDSSVWQKIFPFLTSKQHRASDFIDSETHFVITLKGHFRLNPVIMIDK